MNVFGNTMGSSSNILDTSLFVQKPYLRTIYKESDFVEDFDFKLQLKIYNLPNCLSPEEVASRTYVDKKCNDLSILKITAHVDFKDRNLDNDGFVKLNSLPAVRGHLTPELYIENAIDKPSLVGNNKKTTLTIIL